MQSALRSRSNLLRIFGTILALALLIYLLGQFGWEEIGEGVGRIQTWRFFAALLLMFFSRFFVVGRWHALLRSGGVKASLGQSTRITFAGLFANNFLLSTVGGDVARLGGALQMGFDGAISAASLVADRVVGLLGMSLALPFGLQGVIEESRFSLGLGWLPLAAVTQRGAFGRLVDRLLILIRRVFGALKLWLAQPQAILLALLFSLLHMASLFGAITILLDGMGESLAFLQIAGLWSLVYVVTLLPFTINAFGLQEVSIAYAFTQLGGVSGPNSAVLALLVRTLFMLASLPGALFLSDVLPGVAKAQPILKKLDE